MKYERAKPFSNGTEYKCFKHEYCEKCTHHKVHPSGFPELTEDGGCPIEDDMDYARLNIELFPRAILEISDGDKVVKYHHCMFFQRSEEE